MVVGSIPTRPFMCKEYIINGKIISNQKELRDFINKALPFVFINSPKGDTCCLCDVDVAEISNILNQPLAKSPMFYHFGNDEIQKAIKEYGKESVDLIYTFIKK